MKKRRRHSKRKRLTIILSIVAIVLLIAVGVLVAFLAPNRSAKANSNASAYLNQDDTDWGNRLTYKGKQYRRNENRHTVLFLGVDQEADEEWEGYEDGYEGLIGNAGRSDAILLFILDDETLTNTILSVSRDTMTDVDVYDMKGNFAYTTPIQVNMQYSYGDSPSRSLFLSKRTIDRLLYNIRIDGALSLTMDGISAIVDQLGGITLTMNKDYSYIDPSYLEGERVKLDGAQMEHFIRYRDTSVAGSNEERMERTSWLIGAVFQDIKDRGSRAFLEDLIESDPEYIESDCDAELLKNLTRYNILDTKYKVPGEVVEGEFHDEFYVDEEALQDLIVQLLYVPVEEE